MPLKFTIILSGFTDYFQNYSQQPYASEKPLLCNITIVTKYIKGALCPFVYVSKPYKQ